MPTNTSKPAFFTRLARGLLSRQAVWIYWIVNIALFVGLVVWICLDGKFSQAASLFFGSSTWEDTFLQSKSFPLHLGERLYILHVIIFYGVITALGLLASLFVGVSSHRSLRSWLAVMLALAAWLTLYTSWPDFAWRAQAWRIQASVPGMEQLATTLLVNWPSEDGQLPEIGPFNAYPIGNPRTLMLLKKPSPPGTNIQISTIERGEGNDLYFQLADNDEGAILARLPQGNQPQAFFSGLEGEYQPIRHRSLGQNWFLVQYLYVPILDYSRSTRHL